MAQDFTSAVMDVDYSPTGREFVAGSYDRSLRIFGHTGGHSREVRAATHMFCKCVFCLVCVGAWHGQCWKEVCSVLCAFLHIMSIALWV